MADEYIYHTPQDSVESSSEAHELFPSQLSPGGTTSTPYKSTCCLPQISMRPVQNIQSSSASRLVDQPLPLQTKVISNNQQCVSPDHQFRPLIPKPEGFVHSPQSTSRQSFAGESSRSPNLRLTPVIKTAPGFKEVYTNQGNNFDPSNNRSSSTQWQDLILRPQDDRFTHSVAPEQPPIQPPPNRWQQARAYRCKVHEPPYLDPHTDDSIAYVEATAELWVTQLILAMTNTKDVKDMATSHHRRLFLSEAMDPLLIEACCREILTVLIDRCKNGFRGPTVFNKALRASHQLEPDRTATCEERIKNVVKVLSWNKRACKDVLYEDWKIRLLVNHPLSYDKEKDSQKGSNDQRRRRQIAEREKIKKTEKELKAYREASGQVAVEQKRATQFGGAFVHTPHVQTEWHYENENDCDFGGFGTSLGKRPAYEEYGGSDVKRQRM